MFRRETSREYESGRVQETETNAQFYYPQEDSEFPEAAEVGEPGPAASGRDTRVLGPKARTAEQRQKGSGQIVENLLHG